MTAVLLIIVMLCGPTQNAATKAYLQRTNNKGTYVFSIMSMAAELLFYTATSGGNLHFFLGLVPWSVSVALGYGLATLFSYFALTCGSMALTSLVLSYSLILPTFFGILFLDEPLGSWLLLGILLLCTSLFFINYKPGKYKVTLRWIIFVTISFLGNGLSTITLKLHQVHFDGGYKNELMLLADSMIFLSMLFIVLYKERDSLIPCLKKGYVFGLISGATNGVENLAVLFLTSRMAASVMFPTLSAGGILITAAVSLFIFKEKLSRNQIIGIILGAGAILFLNM